MSDSEWAVILARQAAVLLFPMLPSRVRPAPPAPTDRDATPAAPERRPA